MSEGDPDHVREWVQSEPETEAKERPLISHVFFPGLKKNSSNCAACWELGFQAWAQSTCPELSAQGLVPLRWGAS